jgi:hypothetical protein
MSKELIEGLDRLKPCPCCGAESYELIENPRIFDGQSYEGYKSSTGYKYRCEGCGLQTCWWHTKEELIEAWNTRTDDQLIKQQEERIKHLGERCEGIAEVDSVDSYKQVNRIKALKRKNTQLKEEIKRKDEALGAIVDEAYGMLDMTYCTKGCHTTEVTKEHMRKDISFYCTLAEQALKPVDNSERITTSPSEIENNLTIPKGEEE